MDDIALIEAAQGGDQLASERLLHRHQRLLDAHASRFYLPGGDVDDIVQEARIGFMKAVRFYRGGRGSTFRSFAKLCVSRRLAGALTQRDETSTPWSPTPSAGTRPSASWTALPDCGDSVDLALARAAARVPPASRHAQPARAQRTDARARRLVNRRRHPAGWGDPRRQPTIRCSGPDASSPAPGDAARA
jgi:DNA-directed RNA polymerase specialized sigma24 family protein